MPRSVGRHTPASSNGSDLGGHLEDLTIRSDNGHQSNRSRSDSVISLESFVPDVRAARTSQSWQHGNEIITLTVGKGNDQQDFTIHRALATQKSPELRKLIRSATGERLQQGSLPDHTPATFEIIYQYLYTGKVDHSAHNEDSHATADYFWFLALKLAVQLRMRDLEEKIFDVFAEDILNLRRGFLPATTFIEELLKSELDGTILQLKKYFVAQVADALIERHDRRPEWDVDHWNKIFETYDQLSLMVMKRMSRLKVSDTKAVRRGSEHMSNFVPVLGAFSRSLDGGRRRREKVESRRRRR